MRIRAILLAATTAPLLVGGTAFAKGGDPGTPPAARCATVTVTNTGQTVRHPDQMPEMKYNLENCGTDTVTVAVTFSEAPGFLSVVCPAPVAAPQTFVLAPKAKVAGTAAVFRGPCGTSGPTSFTYIWNVNAWQGHNVAVTPIDTSTGTAIGSSPWFSWQDAIPRV